MDRETPDNQNTPMNPQQQADDLVVDGLLRKLADHDQEARSKRLHRVSTSLHARSATTHQKRHPYRVKRWPVSLAAMILIALLIGLPTSPSAMADVEQSILTLQSSKEYRFEVRVYLQDQEEADSFLVATIDSRSSDSMVIRHAPPPLGRWVTVGRDEMGEWAIDHAGEITRTNARRYFPPWSFDDQELIVDSMDRVLEQLLDQYVLSKDTQPVESANGEQLTKITAHYAGEHQGPKPDQVTVLINPTTDLPVRIEMHWDPNRPHLSFPPRDRKRRFGIGPRMDHQMDPGMVPGMGSGMDLKIDFRKFPVRIVFELVPTPELDADWFEPAHHQSP